MKRILLIAFFGLTMFSCKKEQQKCYHCTFGPFNGTIPPPVDYCGDDGGTRQFKDANGNDLTSQCIEKH